VHAPEDVSFVEGFLLKALSLPEGEALVSSKLEPGAVIVNEIERGALSPVTVVGQVDGTPEPSPLVGRQPTCFYTAIGTRRSGVRGAVREVGYWPDFCRRRLRSVRFMRWRWRLSTYTLASMAGSRSDVATVRLVVLRLFMKDGKVAQRTLSSCPREADPAR
jgi:hypothetical protein